MAIIQIFKTKDKILILIPHLKFSSHCTDRFQQLQHMFVEEINVQPISASVLFILFFSPQGIPQPGKLQIDVQSVLSGSEQSEKWQTKNVVIVLCWLASVNTMWFSLKINCN